MRTSFLINIVLTFIWLALTGSFYFLNFVFGFLLCFAILWIVSSRSNDQRYFKLTYRILSLFLYFIYELIKANMQVAYDVITPNFYMQPGIIRVPLDAKSDMEITLLANIISLTPGSLSLDVSDDRKVLYVHSMYIRDKDTFIKSIKNGFEKRILAILR